MSVQFGRWNWEGQPLTPDCIEKVSATLAAYGPDSNELYSDGRATIVYRAFHTTKESHGEKQPHTSRSGAVITWDGRLDNRADLLIELGGSLTVSSTDVEIVAASYEKWSTHCFANLIGDWALSIWSTAHQSLILATDFTGMRHLYYSIENNYVAWSTVLDPLVRFTGKTFRICEEYIAGWLAGNPAPQLTPYADIHAVPPSCFVLIHPRKYTISKYWDLDPGKAIRYRADSEYEEHFRTVFAAAVRRRLRCDRPVLAELSGGMDSSSIVCMADVIIARGEAETPRLDTISYYDDSTPGLDERPYVAKVEQLRGRTGYHVDLGAKSQLEKSEVDPKQSWLPAFGTDQFAATPNSDRNVWPELFDQYALYMSSHQYRVTLSGLAGEDPTGGYIPSPTPELQDLLVRARFFRLARQLDAWAAKMGRSRLPLLWKALRGFYGCSLTFPCAAEYMCPPPWLQPDFVRRYQAALHWYPSKLKPFGALPSFQNHIHQLNHNRRFLASRDLCPRLLREVRYPYLDRDLLEFAYAIPQEQVVGVGKRRFLMKRALVGIVPNELLNRKQRAVVIQELNKDNPTVSKTWGELKDNMLSSSLGIVDAKLFLHTLQEADSKEEVTVDRLKRTLVFEFWLQHLAAQGLLTMTTTSAEMRRQAY
ncbi:MAG: asparagine synthase-related protein [Candidatus Sulfotelmatobacter sp.]|jgi:asparagine synthase (glutamine-hydrolysing)